MMDQKKFQMYINSDTDPKLYGFIESIESEAPGKRGYAVDKIKEILRAWAGLQEIFEERDVLLLSMRLAASIHGKSTVESPSTVGDVGTSAKNEVRTSPPDSPQTSSTKRLGGFGKDVIKQRFNRG